MKVNELDLNSKLTLKIRKPGRREWIALDPNLELNTRLLAHKSRPDAYDVEYFHVDRSLRGPIQDELQQVQVFPFYSFSTREYALQIIHVTPGNRWYESLAALFRYRGHASERTKLYAKGLAHPHRWVGEADAAGVSSFLFRASKRNPQSG